MRTISFRWGVARGDPQQRKTSRRYTGCVWDSYGMHTGCIRDSYGYIAVTSWLHRSYIAVTWRLYGGYVIYIPRRRERRARRPVGNMAVISLCYMAVTWRLYPFVTWRLHGGYMAVTSLVAGSGGRRHPCDYMSVTSRGSWRLHGGYMSVTSRGYIVVICRLYPLSQGVEGGAPVYSEALLTWLKSAVTLGRLSPAFVYVLDLQKASLEL